MDAVMRSAAALKLKSYIPSKMYRGLKALDRGAIQRAEALSLLRTDPGAALRLYEELRRARPSHPMHWIGLGLSQIAVRQPVDVDLLERAQHLVISNPAARPALAELQRQAGRPRAALDTLLQCIREGAGRDARSAAIRLAERLADDEVLISLLDPIAEASKMTSEDWIKLIRALSRTAGERAARKAVRTAVRATGDALPLHGLMEVYAAVGQQRRARLLNRYLTRVWPHSQHHARTYARRLAAVGFTRQADACLRQLVATSKGAELEREYAELPYISGDFAEAARRYAWLARKWPHDISAYLAWGYALANVDGIDAAERHFQAAAAGVENYSALVALAHMAMRRRDRAAAARRWGEVARIYPHDAAAVIEQARAYFDQGDGLRAIQLCERWRARQPRLPAIDEFLAWLNAHTGRFQLALALAKDVLSDTGPTWTISEILLQCAGTLENLADMADYIIESFPSIENERDVGHAYSAMRMFEYFGSPAPFFERVLPSLGGFRLDWAKPYLEAHALGVDETLTTSLHTLRLKAQADHRSLVRCTRADLLLASGQLSKTDVRRVLEQARARQADIHIVNMFEQASGGSELHALDLGERLKDYANVSYWAPEYPNPIVAADRGVQPIDPSNGRFPRSGVLVFVGVYFSLGPWLRQVRPDRILILYNTFDAVRLSNFVRTLHEFTQCKVELLFCSDMMQNESGLPGLFEPSPIDLDEFRMQGARDGGQITIGRHSRDVPEKHHHCDGRVYARLIEQGARVSLLGATCMSEIFPKMRELKLLPAQRGGIREYLGQLDIFFYRTGTWIEPWGRVVIEAMACGLPVVVHERGGYAQAINHGIDGFLFNTDEEAVEQLVRLKDDFALRRRIGLAARQKVEALLGEEAMQRLMAVYLMPQAPAA